MARKLSSKQIAILKNHSDVMEWADLPFDVQEELERYNDYETLIHDVNRFLGDQFYAMRNADGSLRQSYRLN